MWIAKVWCNRDGFEGRIVVDDRDVVWAKSAQDGQGWPLPALAAGMKAVAEEFGGQYTGHYILTTKGEVVRVGDLVRVGEVTPTHTNIPLSAAADVAAALRPTGDFKVEIDRVY